MAPISHPFTDKHLRDYLLGLVSEEEAARLDEAAIADDEIAARLGGLEDDLFDDYAGGSMIGQERSRFEERYLASEPGRRRLDFARALGERRHGTARPISWLRSSLPWLSAAAVLVAVILARLYVVGLPSSTEGANASGAPTPAPPVPAVVAFTLIPTATRSATATETLSFPAGTASVALRLIGLPETKPVKSPVVVVRTVDGREVFRADARPVVGERDGVLAEVVVPASVLTPDDYVVQLNEMSQDGGEERVRYFLRVRAR